MNGDNRPDPQEFAEAANIHAARSTQAWLMGRGLAAEVELLRHTPDGDPISAPRLDDLLDELGDACMEACTTSDAVFNLLSDDMDDDTEAAADTALDASDDHATRAEWAMRRIAEILLGVSTRSAPGDAVSRAERAAVVALKWHPGADEVVDDGVKLGARTYEELITELSGTLCRMIIDHDAVLRLAPADGTSRRALLFAINGTGDLDMMLIDPSLPSDGSAEAEAPLIEIGWGRTGAGLSARWEDPLVVLEPAMLTVETLRDAWEMGEPLDLAVFAERQGDVF